MRSTVAALTSSNEVGDLAAEVELQACSMPMTFKAQTKLTASTSTSQRTSLRCKRYALLYFPPGKLLCVCLFCTCTDCELPVCLWQVGGKRPKICSERPPKRCRMSRSCRAAHTGAWRPVATESLTSLTVVHAYTLAGLHGLCEPQSTSLLSVK